MKVTVVGAGFVGMTCAQRLAEQEVAENIVLIDVLEGRPQGIALDINQAAAVEGYQALVTGTNDPKDTYGSDLFIMTAGLPRKPGMDRSDLVEVNGKIINAVAAYIQEGSPEARVIVVSNPLDTMVYLMAEKLGFPKGRVVGMAGVLDSARMAFFIAEKNRGGIADTRCMVLGGHGDSMVPVPQFSTVDGVSIQALLPDSEIDEINTRTQHGGAEIVNLLKTGSAFYAPSAAAVAMAKSILRDENRLLPTAAFLDGQYGLKDIYMGVPCVLGKNGVERIVDLELDDAGRQSLHASADAIRADLDTLREKGLM
ncbi:MAG: malate dehydrogenase [Planctomycetes bacterium]|nr:malate dehydrogenase [Planctomycetota bacterium]MCP4772463.1 malate dehydrogenase [Planctomycetota bacterium]MCP4860144.1 malate dehydrogenase [Planctomycetota bacterium]